MHKPRKHVSFTRMQEILAKHANGNQAGTVPSDAGLVAPVASGSLPNTLDPACGMKKADACGDVHEAAETEGPRPQLCWNRVSPTCMQSGCQRFQIHKEVFGNDSHGGLNLSNGKWTYQCWHRVEWLWFIKFSPPQESFEAAKVLCEAFARAHPIGAKASAA